MFTVGFVLLVRIHLGVLKKNNMKSREEALITAAQTKKNDFVFCYILAGAALGSCGKFSCVAGAVMISQSNVFFVHVKVKLLRPHSFKGASPML